jgi:hypothetical protein
LRHRLIRRGVTIPAGLLAAGAASQAQAAIPVTLIRSTIRIALGFLAGNTAAVLARGVLNSMMLNQLKVAMVLLYLGIGGGYGVWQVRASLTDDKVRPNQGKVAQTPVSSPNPETIQPMATYRLIGSVRVEGTREPVQGGRFSVLLGDGTNASDPDRSRTVTSGENGGFLVELPPGQASAWIFQAPVGYWAPGNKKSQETFVLSRSQPIHRKDYVVRRGAVWPFHLVGADGKPVEGSVRASIPDAVFRSDADEGGRVNLTLPTEGRKVMAGVLKAKELSQGLASIPIVIPLEWSSGFRPAGVKSIERVPGGYRVKDDAGRIATIGASARDVPDGVGRSIPIGESGRVEPTLVDGKFMIRVFFSEAGRVESENLSGRVVDEADQPVRGARVALAFHEAREGNRGGSAVFPDDKEHEAITNRNGRFLIRAIPRSDVAGKPTSLSLIVRKNGFTRPDPIGAGRLAERDCCRSRRTAR